MNLSTLDFEQARTKHLHFKTQLRAILYGEDVDHAPVLSHHECSVGKWIYGYALYRYQHIPEIQELEKLHEDLHVCARELVELYKSGKIPEARDGLAWMEEIAERLVSLMTAIETKVLQEEKAHQNKFRESVEQAPVAMIILRGKDVVVEMVNDKYLQLVDRTKEELLGRSFYLAVPETTERVRPLFNQVLDTGIPYHGNEFEVTINRYGRPENGFFNFVYQPLKDDNDVVDGIIAVVTEVTEQVRTKHALQESETRFRNLIAQSPVAMTIFKGTDFVIDMANDTMVKRMWRRTTEEVMGRKLLDVFPELASQPFPELLKQVYDSGIPHKDIEALAYVDGPDGMKRFYLDYEYAPLFDLDKKVYAIMATVYDVTERKENELALRQSEEKFRVLADSMPQFIWTADIEGNMNYFSENVYEYTGMTAREVHDNWLDIVHPSEREASVQQWQHAVSSGEPFIFEHRFRKHDGTYRWQLSRAVPQKDAAGKIQMWVGTSTDIHEGKISFNKLEAQVLERTKALQHSNDELKKTNSELAQFAYVASHDLQEPLRKIQTFASRLVETEFGSLSERGRDYFGRMQSAAKRMQQLIEDLLSFSHTTNNGDQLFEQTDLSAILIRVQELLSDQIQTKQVQIYCDPLPVLPVIAYQLEQLFTNLLNNAIKFSRTDVPLHIEIRQDHRPIVISGIAYYKITVADNGIGFDPQFNERIFQVFQRLHAKNKFEGTGIGLAICKKIMDNHKGYISAVGKPNEGATFTLLFPVV